MLEGSALEAAALLGVIVSTHYSALVSGHNKQATSIKAALGSSVTLEYVTGKANSCFYPEE